jgi:hypothetical protein
VAGDWEIKRVGDFRVALPYPISQSPNLAKPEPNRLSKCLIWAHTVKYDQEPLTERRQDAAGPDHRKICR